MTSTPTYWIAENGDGVCVGDAVALRLHRDSTGEIIGVAGETGYPVVKFTAGPGIGGEASMHPSQILMKLYD